MSVSPVFARPLDAERQQALWNLVCRIFNVDLNDWTELRFNGEPFGYLNPLWRERLMRDWPGRIQADARQVDVQQPDWLALGDALQHMAAQWQRTGELSGWRNEWFDVCAADGSVRFALERAAFRPLGLASRAVHVNGLVRQPDGDWAWWIARRSPFKAVDPNKLDNLVGGGIASSECVHQALVRESWEEAGLPAEYLPSSLAHHVQHSLRAVSRGLHREWLHVFDVFLPAGVTPENQDGEVAAFVPMSSDDLVAAMLQGRLMNDALLATLDAFERHGLLDAHLPLAQWLQRNRQAA